MQQIKFLDTDDGVCHGGILLPSGKVVCACCGRILDIEDDKLTILKKYDDWLDFSDAIID